MKQELNNDLPSTVQGIVRYCKLDDWSEHKGNYSVEVWVTTPFGNFLATVQSGDYQGRRLKKGEIVTLKCVERAKDPYKKYKLRCDKNYYTIVE